MQPVLYDLENEITMEDLNNKACEYIKTKRALLCAVLLTSNFKYKLKNDMKDESKMAALDCISGDKLTIFYYNNVGMIKNKNILIEDNEILIDGISLLKKREREYYNKFINRKYEEIEKFFPNCKLERKKNYLILFNPFDYSRIQYINVGVETIDEIIEIVEEIVRDLNESYENNKVLYNFEKKLIFKKIINNIPESKKEALIAIIKSIDFLQNVWRENEKYL